jgi:hypothetical protein
MHSRTPLLVLAFVGTGIALPALAQQPSPYPPPCDASKVSRADVERAHQVFLSGKGFLEESNYDKAISYFKDAYSIDCSVHAILPIIATAYERKGDKASAVQALEEYLKRAPNASDREIVERRIANLKQQIAASATAATAATAATTATTAPTATATTAPTTTALAATSTATAAPASTAGTAPTESGAALSPEGGGHTAAPWVVVGVGGAAVVGGVVLYAVGSSDVSTAQNQCPSRSNCPKNVADQGNSGRTLETVGGVLGGVGLAAVIGGLAWHFLEPTSPASASASATRVSPIVAPGYAGLAVGGAF